MSVTLYAIPPSHPSHAARLMLERKGIEHKVVNLVPGTHAAAVRVLGFSQGTVPALKLEGRRVQGSRQIARALDEARAEPKLFPDDPEARLAVEEAERWGDEVLQPVPRRLVWASLKRERSTLTTYLEDAHLGIPVPLAARMATPVVFLAARLNRATDEAVRRDLGVLPALIDRVDELIAEGVIGRPERNLADYQIATSVALLLSMDDLRRMIEGRPAAAHSRAVVVRYPGRLPRALPAAWLPR